MPRSAQHLAKRWVFTLNNPAASFDDDFYEFNLDDSNGIEYAAWQHEIAPETQTPHIQGLVIFTERQTLAKVRRVLDTAHWEVMRGTIAQALDYVHKVETRDPATEPHEVGVLEVCSCSCCIIYE